MKKLFVVLMVLMLILSACSTQKEPPAEQPESEESASDILTEEADENLLPGGIDPADYDEVEKYDGVYVLLNKTDETCKRLSFFTSDAGWVGNHRLADLPADEVWFLSPDGKIINEEPFQYYDWMFDYIAGFRNGYYECYEITENGLELFVSEAPETKEYFGFKVTSYRWEARIRCYGVTAPDGSVFAESNYEIVDIPFEDRIMLFDGSSQSWNFTRCNILDPEGNIINNSYNHVEYFICDDGYIGIAFCGSRENDPEHRQTFDPEGNPMPSGFWFVDKDGKPVSEKYIDFYVNEEWNGNLAKASEDDIVHVFKENGEEMNFSVKDLLIK